MTTFEGDFIPAVPKAKSPGVSYDPELTCIAHIHHMKTKFMKALSLLRPPAPSWGSHPLLMLKVYTGYVRDILKWVLPMFANASKACKKLLEPVQSQAWKLSPRLLECVATSTDLDMSGLSPLRAVAIFITDKCLF